MKRYIVDYFRYKLSHIIGGKKNYEGWKTQNYSLKSAEIKNKALAKELEEACRKKGDFLTYSEYLHIEQFGRNGYHATHDYHGFQPNHMFWNKALVSFCKKENIQNILEFGYGGGELALSLLKQARKNGLDLVWSGIEINTSLHVEIRKKFKKENLEKQLEATSSTIDALAIKPHTLMVFSYSLDSIPPEIFINTAHAKSHPTTIIGVIIKNGRLQEIALSQEQMKKNNISLINGVYASASGKKFDLTSWKLYPGQRAYISIQAYEELINASENIDDSSHILIMDEFLEPPFSWETDHFCLPKDLDTYVRTIKNIEKSYKEAGEALWYYPFYLRPYLDVLKTTGFKKITYDFEVRLAASLNEAPVNEPERQLCLAILASNRIKKENLQFPITFPNANFKKNDLAKTKYSY